MTRESKPFAMRCVDQTLAAVIYLWIPSVKHWVWVVCTDARRVHSHIGQVHLAQ